MEKLLEEIIEEFHREFPIEIVERDLKTPLDINKAISIIGLRRVGKTFYLYQIAKQLLELGVPLKEVFYINFEDERLLEFTPKDFSKVVEIYYKKNPKAKKVHLLFDEIQNVENWEKFVRRLLEKQNFRIFLTGSSSKLLSKEIATSLRGRTLSYYLFPFSFKEFLKAKSFKLENTLIERDRGIIKGLLEEYIKFGGFPEIVNYSSMEKIRTLKEYLDLIVYKDLVDRYKIEKINAIKFIIKFLVRNFGRALSIRKVHSFLSSTMHSLSKNKTYQYFSYLEDINFIFLIRRFGTGIKEIEASTPKVYINDIGFATVYGIEDIGSRIENIVAIELLRKKHYFNPLLEIYYWKDNHQREVDFVLKEGFEVKKLVQVTYASGKDEIEKRELDAMIKASIELRCKDLLVVTWDYEDETKIEGTTIKFIPLWKLLLG